MTNNEEAQRITALCAKLRSEFLDLLNERVQVRLQPLRVVVWAEDGSDATRIATAKTTAEAERIRSAEIARRLAAFDKALAEVDAYCDVGVATTKPD